MEITFEPYYDESYELDGFAYFSDGQKIYDSVSIQNPGACLEFVNATKPASVHEAVATIIFFRERGRIEMPTGNPETDIVVKKLKNLILSKEVTPTW